VIGSGAGTSGVLFAQGSSVSTTRANSCHYCPAWLTGLWLSLGFLTLLLSGACKPGVPVVDVGPKPPAARGTLTGTVRGPEVTWPVAGRTVEIFNTATGEKHTTTTSETGGFTIQLPAGKYRLELPLKDGETIAKRPGIIDLARGDIDSHVEFVLATTRVNRSRGPAYRVDNGLGSPIA
jgi:Carboxypeptidase regulatory-like domain